MLCCAALCQAGRLKVYEHRFQTRKPAVAARTGALHVRLDQAAQVRLACRRLHALDGHNLRVDEGGEVAWQGEEGQGCGGGSG